MYNVPDARRSLANGDRLQKKKAPKSEGVMVLEKVVDDYAKVCLRNQTFIINTGD